MIKNKKNRNKLKIIKFKMENGNDIENENNKLPNNMKLFNERSPDMSDLNDDKEPKIPISNIKAGEFNLELEYINNSKDM